MALSFVSYQSMAKTIHFPINEPIIKEYVLSHNLDQVVVILQDGNADHYHKVSYRKNRLDNQGREYDIVYYQYDRNKEHEIYLQVYDNEGIDCIYEFRYGNKIRRDCIRDSDLVIKN